MSSPQLGFAIVGTGTVFGDGIRFLSISEVVTGSDEVLIYVEGDDLAQSPDTIPLGASSWEGEFPNGLDSANVIVLPSGVELGAHASN